MNLLHETHVLIFKKEITFDAGCNGYVLSNQPPNITNQDDSQ